MKYISILKESQNQLAHNLKIVSMLLTDFLSTLRVMIIAGVNANFYFYIILAHFHGSSQKEDFSA